MTVEQIMPFVLGPAMTRLAMEFENKEAYRNYWKPQPAFAERVGRQYLMSMLITIFAVLNPT
jgi:hypothetical protein